MAVVMLAFDLIPTGDCVRQIHSDRGREVPNIGGVRLAIVVPCAAYALITLLTISYGCVPVPLIYTCIIV